MNAYQSHAKTGVLVDAVVFDLGGVLIDWNQRHLYRRLFGRDVEGMERFLADVCSPVWNARQDAGRSWDEAIAEAVAAHPEHVEAASRVGLNALVYRDARHLRMELAGFGLPVCL